MNSSKQDDSYAPPPGATVYLTVAIRYAGDDGEDWAKFMQPRIEDAVRATAMRWATAGEDIEVFTEIERVGDDPVADHYEDLRTEDGR